MCQKLIIARRLQKLQHHLKRQNHAPSRGRQSQNDDLEEARSQREFTQFHVCLPHLTAQTLAYQMCDNTMS